MRVRVCVCACACACVRACVCAQGISEKRKTTRTAEGRRSGGSIARVGRAGPGLGAADEPEIEVINDI